MIVPRYLTKGDRVAVVATARKVSADEMAAGLAILESWGLDAQIGPNLYAASHQFAGSDGQRLHDLQWALDTPEIKAVFMARGGYGTTRLIDHLRFDRFLDKPKWLVGFSDITALHCHLNRQLGVASLHAPMMINIQHKNTEEEVNSIGSVRKALFGEPLHVAIPSHKLNREGDFEGELIGGNLSVIYSLLGSESAPVTDNKILFLEDLDEYLYHVDRMMLNLKRTGLLSNLAGLLVGGMTEMNDNTIPFGKTAEQIISDQVSGFSYPVRFGFPAGHIPTNLALRMGMKARISGLEFRQESQ